MCVNDLVSLLSLSKLVLTEITIPKVNQVSTEMGNYLGIPDTLSMDVWMVCWITAQNEKT